MLPVEVVFTALFGLAFGSFLNVCIVRLPRGESVVHPPSRCPGCGVPIRPVDNIPVLSWLLLRGRARCCRQWIALQYPLVETATALLFVGCLLRYGPGVAGIGMMVFCWLLLGLGCMDAETYLLPDAFTLTGLALGLVYKSLNTAPYPYAWSSLLDSTLSAAALGGLLLVAALIYRAVRGRDGLGLGDVKLMAMIGAWLGWQQAGVALFLGVMAGAVTGIVLMISSRKEHVPARGLLRLPLGSFLAGAGIITVFTGKWLLAWYLHFFV